MSLFYSQRSLFILFVLLLLLSVGFSLFSLKKQQDLQIQLQDQELIINEILAINRADVLEIDACKQQLEVMNDAYLICDQQLTALLRNGS